jgi:NifU-like protein involved in Fe-S cluster formation
LNFRAAAPLAAVALLPAPLYIANVTTALYNRDILRLAASIPHLERLDAPQASATRRSTVCGSQVTVDVVTGSDGRVAELGQEVRACALGQASASLMAAHALGRTAEEIATARDRLAAFLAGASDDPGDWPGLAIFRDARPFTARHPSILLAFEAAAEAATGAGRH